MKLTLDQAWESFVGQFNGDINEVVAVMVEDVDHYKINNSRATKLLRLASCSSSPVGEKTNAAKMAFSYIAQNFN